MNGANIILSNTQIKSQEFNDLSIFRLSTLYGSSFGTLADLMEVQGSEQAISEAHNQSGMSCEIDDLKLKINIELGKARELLRAKFPIRYRLSLLKILISHPLSSLVSLFKK